MRFEPTFTTAKYVVTHIFTEEFLNQFDFVFQVTEDAVLGKGPPIYHYAGPESSSSSYDSSSSAQEPSRAAAGAD